MLLRPARESVIVNIVSVLLCLLEVRKPMNMDHGFSMMANDQVIFIFMICSVLWSFYSINQSISLNIYQFIYLCTYICNYLSIYLSIYISICLSIYLLIYLSIKVNSQTSTDIQHQEEIVLQTLQVKYLVHPQHLTEYIFWTELVWWKQLRLV